MYNNIQNTLNMNNESYIFSHVAKNLACSFYILCHLCFKWFVMTFEILHGSVVGART